MTTAEYIGYYNGTILGGKNGLYLVHYGDAETVYYGIGCMVRNQETGKEYPSFHSDRAANPFWADLIKRLHAHPEIITEFINPKYSNAWVPLPLDEANLAAVMERIHKDNEDYKPETIFPDFVIVRRTRQIHDDRYAIVTYREPGHFEGAPPLWDKTISKEEAEMFSRDLNAMYAYYSALKAEEDARRREAAASYEQYKREHPELYSKKPLSKRKKRKLKKRLENKHPHSNGYDRYLNSQQKGQ